MPAIQRKKTYGVPSLGLNDILTIQAIDDNELAEINNAKVNEHGALEKYEGLSLDGSPFPNSTDSFIRTLINFKRGTSVDWLLAAAQDDNNTNSTYKVDFKYTSGDGNYFYIGHTIGTATFTHGSTAVTGTGTDWNTGPQLKAGDKIKNSSDPDSDYTEIFSVNSDTSLTLVSNYPGTSGSGVPYIARIVLNKNTIPAATVFNNKAIISNGSEPLMAYDSVSLNVVIQTNPFGIQSDVPKPFFLEPHKNRLFAADNTSNIYWSDPLVETGWDPAAKTPVYPSDNGSIVAIKSFGDSLIVVKDIGKIYQVVGNFDTDPGTFAFIRKIDYPEKTIGIIDGRTVTSHKGYLYFIAEGGLFRLDQRMTLAKVTRNLDTFNSTLDYGTAGTPTAKNFPYTTAAQWNAGTHNGTHATPGGVLEPFFDLLTVSDSNQAQFSTSCAIDTNNVVHIAYVDTSGNLKHIEYDTDGTSTNEIVVTASGNIVSSVAIDISSSGLVGILYSQIVSGCTINFIEKSGGVWGTPQILTNIGGSGPFGVSFKYASDNKPRCTYSGSLGSGLKLLYATKASGSFVYSTVANFSANSGPGAEAYNMSLAIAGNGNVGISTWGEDNVFHVSPNFHLTVNFYLTTNDGSSWANVENFDTGLTIATPSKSYTASFIQLDTNSSNNFITGFCPTSSTGSLGNPFMTRNHSTTTTTTLVSSASTVGLGFRVGYSDDFFAYYTNNSGNTEAYLFENSSTLSQSATMQSNNSSLTATNRGMASNGHVFTSIAYGSNINQLIVRRISFSSTWTSNLDHDATLSAWGTYQAVHNDLGNTVGFGISLSTTTFTPTSATYTPITPGTVISSNNTLVFAATQITFVLTSFSQPTVTSVLLNYTGSGVSPKQGVAISHNNELFISKALQTALNDNKIIVIDLADAILKTDYAVFTLERFKKKLYAGSSTNGNVYILKQNFDYAGSAYSMDVQTKEFFLDSLDLQKEAFKFYLVYTTQSSGTLTFSWRYDNYLNPNGSAWNSKTIDLTKPGPADIPINTQKFSSLQFRFQNSEVGTQLKILGYTLVYGYLNQR